MAVSDSFRDFVVDQLQDTVRVTPQPMFGGVGLYGEDFYFFAILDDDRLYFKVDDTNRPDFERAGMDPFRPYGDERTLQYYEVPASVLEDRDELGRWAKKAIRVSKRAQTE